MSKEAKGTGAATRLVAFLRAINVGGHTVKMEELRRLFEELGLANVETFIASGNVIFDALDREERALEKQVESHLRASLGYDVATFVRSASDLARIADCCPFPADDLEREGAGLYIAFLQTAPGAEARRRLLDARTAVDEFHIDGREVYWLCRTRFSESLFSGPRLEKTLGMPTTVRNSTTVRKLAAKYAGS